MQIWPRVLCFSLFLSHLFSIWLTSQLEWLYVIKFQSRALCKHHALFSIHHSNSDHDTFRELQNNYHYSYLFDLLAIPSIWNSFNFYFSLALLISSMYSSLFMSIFWLSHMKKRAWILYEMKRIEEQKNISKSFFFQWNTWWAEHHFVQSWSRRGETLFVYPFSPLPFIVIFDFIFLSVFLGKSGCKLLSIEKILLCKF